MTIRWWRHINGNIFSCNTCNQAIITSGSQELPPEKCPACEDGYEWRRSPVYQVPLLSESGRTTWLDVSQLSYVEASNNPHRRILYKQKEVDALKADNSKLRKAAEEVLRCFDLNSRYSVGFEIACENLRTAMEEKK